MKETVIWNYYFPSRSYVRIKARPFPVSGSTISLENFLDTDVRDDATNVIQALTHCQNNPHCPGLAMDVTDITKLADGHITVTFMYVDNLPGMITSFETLINIIEQWDKVYKGKPSYIILERNGDNYSVHGAESIENIQ